MFITINRTVLWLLASLIVAALSLNFFFLSRVHLYRIAYVRSYDLINGYAGTLEARKDFEQKKSAMLANVDSLRIHVDRSVASYRRSPPGLTPLQRSEKEKELGVLQQQYMQYSEAIDAKIKEDDEKIMSARLAQVNSYVERYAREEGINIVMGTTLSGSLLYGDEDLDITEQLLRRLNDNFKGKQ